MTTSKTNLPARWPTRLVALLLLLCGLYGSYRAVHLAIVNDEVGMLDCAHQTSYIHLVLGDEWQHGWDSQRQFLAVILVKPCLAFLPLNEITASRLPSLLGLALFLWGVWRIGLVFPTGATRVLITLALLSNAFLLDFFSLARGYGLAVGFTTLSLSFLVRASLSKSVSDKSAQRQAGASLWLAAGAALSNMGFLYFYAAVLAIVIWLGWRSRPGVDWWVSTLLLGVVYVGRLIHIQAAGELYFGGTTGFVHDTIGSLVRASFYDRRMPRGLVQWISGALAVLVLLLAYWSWRERIHAAFVLFMVGALAAALCVAIHQLGEVKYPIERAALYFVPLVILIIGLVAAWSRVRWLRLVLWGLLLTFSGIGLQGANLSHTFVWRECADIPSVLLALREAHQQTGQEVMVAISGSKWTIWYYAEHLLGLHPEPAKSDQPYLRSYEWLTTCEWSILQPRYGLLPDNPLLPGTTHLLSNLLNQDDQRLLATPLPGGLAELHFYPASDTTLGMLIKPQYQGTVTIANGQKYVGEFRRGLLHGRGTGTWPDGRQYVGQFEDGKPNGQGAATWPDGQKYVGGFKDGSFDGQGAYTWPDGREYVGEFKDGAPNGQGTGTWRDGQKHVGAFRDGVPNGPGMETWPDGRKYVGEFHEGQPDGVGKMTYPDGRVEDGPWKQGQFAGPALP